MNHKISIEREHKDLDHQGSDWKDLYWPASYDDSAYLGSLEKHTDSPMAEKWLDQEIHIACMEISLGIIAHKHRLPQLCFFGTVAFDFELQNLDFEVNFEIQFENIYEIIPKDFDSNSNMISKGISQLISKLIPRLFS